MITLTNVSKSFGSKVIFDGLSASIDHRARTGFIGPNGAGKTMLMRMLVGSESPDSGTVSVPSSVRLGYLPQELSLDTGVTPLTLVLEPFAHLLDASAAFERVAESAHDDAEHRKALRSLDNLHTQMLMHDAYSLEPRAKAILSGLGVPQASWDQDVRHLSGGYHMRVALARILLLEPDFLLLDEPTNHLDMDALIWLESFLSRHRGGMLIISHDRDFLCRTTGRTIEISQARFVQYNGPVDKYLVWKEEQEDLDGRRRKNLEDKIDQANAFIERFRAKNTKATLAQSKMKLVERLERELPPQGARTGATIHFRLRQPIQSGSVPLEAKSLSVAYAAEPVFSGVSLSVKRQDKIAIIGPNGVGKTTLLKACAGLIEPVHGTITAGHNTRISYYSQLRLDQLRPDLTLYETIASVSSTSQPTVIRSILGAFLFSGDDADKKVGVLSGGEKSRVSLAAMLAAPGNLLLLDEPTNHLDIESVEHLTAALESFDGSIIMVSHDEYLVSRVANRIIEMRQNVFRDFPGTLSEYRYALESGFVNTVAVPDPPAAQKEPGPKPESKEARIHKRGRQVKLERRVKKIEEQIASLEAECAVLDRDIADPAHGQDFSFLADTQDKLNECKQECNELVHEWERLSAELEDIG